MRISDWSSDVCSSDVLSCAPGEGRFPLIGRVAQMIQWVLSARIGAQPDQQLRGDRPAQRRREGDERGVAAMDRFRLADQPHAVGGGIGRAPVREQGGLDVYATVVARSLNKKI